MMHMHAVIMAVLVQSICTPYLLGCSFAGGSWVVEPLGRYYWVGGGRRKEEVVAHDTSGTPNDIIGALHGLLLALVPDWKVRKKKVSPRQDRGMVAPVDRGGFNRGPLVYIQRERVRSTMRNDG